MRALPQGLQAALDGGASTLARCWRLQRSDGVILGFTDHDLPLAFDGVEYAPDSGLTPSTMEAGTGLAADTHDVSGALSSDMITETDILKGLYDGADVTVFLVDWSDVSSRVLLSRGKIGEIRRGTSAFEAEITGLADQLNQPAGRAYVHSCSCRLGEIKCGVDLSEPGFTGSGSVAVITHSQQFSADGLEGFEDGWFSGGLLRWTSGANAGLEAHIKAHLSAGSEVVIDLWLSPPLAVEAGDTFEVLAGCDKTAATCAGKFGNLLNYRGFPHMPGDDVAASYPNSGGNHDGGSLFRS